MSGVPRKDSETIKLRILLPNGIEVMAPLAEWVAAIMLELPEDNRRRVYERIQKKNVFYQTPGSHVLHAEGANFLFTHKKE